MFRLPTGPAGVTLAALVLCFGARTPALAQIACGATIAAGEKVTLTADIGPCSVGTDPALRVIGPATLDMAGHRLLCNEMSPPIGIFVEGKGAKILRGGADGCQVGLALAGEGKHKVDAFLATRNTFQGFVLDSGQNGLKRVAAVDSGLQGFEIEGNGNKIEDAEAVDSDEDGFRINSDANKLKRIVASRNMGDGVRIDGNFNQIKDCRITTSGEDGGEINGSGNKMEKCLSTANSVMNGGFDVDGSNNQLKQNVSVGNDFGFSVGGGGNVVTKNVSLGSGTRDMLDVNAGCGSNSWQKNTFGTSEADGVQSPGCIQ